MSVTTNAIDSIRAMIRSGELRPGERLPPENELAERLGVSRGSLREAVRALSQINVLDVRRGDGTYVTSLEPHLLLEAITGDATLFIRRDEVETAWAIVDTIRNAWVNRPLTNREFYLAGTWGPTAADDLLAEDGREWKNPQHQK